MSNGKLYKILYNDDFYGSGYSEYDSEEDCYRRPRKPKAAVVSWGPIVNEKPEGWTIRVLDYASAMSFGVNTGVPPARYYEKFIERSKDFFTSEKKANAAAARFNKKQGW